MAHYRLYCIDGSGRFFRCDEFSAANDDEAVLESKERRGGSAAELWSGARMVAAFAAAEATGAPARPISRTAA